MSAHKKNKEKKIIKKENCAQRIMKAKLAQKWTYAAFTLQSIFHSLSSSCTLSYKIKSIKSEWALSMWLGLIGFFLSGCIHLLSMPIKLFHSHTSLVLFVWLILISVQKGYYIESECTLAVLMCVCIHISRAPISSYTFFFDWMQFSVSSCLIVSFSFFVGIFT